jgi:hypothetical protein
MDKIPFSVYDFFAYLSSGVVWVITADYILGIGLLNKKDIPVVLGVALIIFAYVCGHIVAHFSSFTMEHILVGRLLKRPTSILMGEKPRCRPLRWAFANYFRPLPTHTRNRVSEQAEARGAASATGEALFMHAYPVVTSNSVIQARLDDFRNQYGFARNMSFALMTSAITIVIAHRLAFHPVRLRWAVLSAVAGVALFYRYLKFFRQYSYELLLRYAELARPDNA